MSWYNPLSWFDLGQDNYVALAVNNYNLVMRSKGDFATGAITKEQYDKLLAVYLEGTNGYMPVSEDDARNHAQRQMDGVIDSETVAAIQNPLAPFTQSKNGEPSTWDKILKVLTWLAIAAAIIIAIFGLNALTKAGRFITGKG